MNWKDIQDMKIEYVEDTLKQLFFKFVHIINQEYGSLKDVIFSELKDLNTTIKFEYNPQVNRIIFFTNSGSTVPEFNISDTENYLFSNDSGASGVKNDAEEN